MVITPADEADILHTKLHKLGSSGAAFQQCLSINPVRPSWVHAGKKTQLFLDGQPIDAAATFRVCPQPGAFPGSFEDGFALRVVHAITHRWRRWRRRYV